MSSTTVIAIVVAIVILILCIASKVMDILVGLIGTIGGIALFAWLGSTDSIMTQLQLAFEYGVNPSDLKTYSIVVIVVGIVLLVIGLSRGKKVEKVVVVQQQVAPTQSEKTETNKKETAKRVEDKKEEPVKEEKKEEK